MNGLMNSSEQDSAHYVCVEAFLRQWVFRGWTRIWLLAQSCAIDQVQPIFDASFFCSSNAFRRLPPQYSELQALMDDLPVWKNLDSGQHGLLAHEVLSALCCSCVFVFPDITLKGAIVDRVAALPDILDKVSTSERNTSRRIALHSFLGSL